MAERLPDGTSRALGAGERIGADERLTQALVDQAPAARCGAVVSVDLFYDDGRRPPAAGQCRPMYPALSSQRLAGAIMKRLWRTGVWN